jgi:hypothetical protein
MGAEPLSDRVHLIDRYGPFGAVRGLPIPGDIPVVVPVHRATPSQPIVEDVASATALALEPLLNLITGRPRVAVTAGSRGIHDIAKVVRAAVAWLRAAGADPFVVPAMGSHGGSTAEGQLAVLADLGVHEAAVEAPVIATMDTVEVGRLGNGTPVHWARVAAEADAVLLINRVKPHTDYRGPVESGLAKIMSVGLGKHRGAEALHAGGVAALGESISEAAQVILRHGNVLGGLAILEDAHERTAAVELVAAAEIGGHRETALLRRAYELLGRLPFTELDVLVVDRHGKDKSGTGMDTNVLGRCWVPGVPEFTSPDITVVTVHGLTPASHGNAAGLGLADIAPLRILDTIDLRATYLNSVTSGTGGLRRARLPMLLEDDAAVVRAAMAMCGRRDGTQIRLARIEDTLALDKLMVTPALLPEVERDPQLTVAGDPVPLVGEGGLSPWPRALVPAG